MTLQQIYTRRQKAHEELLACDIELDEILKKMKPSEIFEGKNSSLRKTFDEAVGVCKLCQFEGGEHSQACSEYKDVCDKHGHPDCMKCFYTTSAEVPKSRKLKVKSIK